MSKRVIDDRFVVIRELGAGSCGTVFLAHPVRENRLVALKILSSTASSAENIHMFREEFALLSHLDHPSIVKIFSFGLTAQKRPYFVMEYVEGPPFDQSFWDQYGQVNFYSIMVDICLALEHLHAYGLIHQDIKPTNILLQTRPQGAPRAKLSDFGLTTAPGTGGGLQLSGTLEYFAPEAIRGATIDRRADLYSLGVTLYEVLTGENPFRAEEPRQILRKHLEFKPEPLRSRVKHIPEILGDIVFKLMEKDPLDRFPTAAAVVDELRHKAGYKLSKEQEQASAILPPGQFVGRKRELLRLQKWHREVQEGDTLLVLIEGTYGLGKSRLLKEFAIQCQLTGTTVLDDVSLGQLLLGGGPENLTTLGGEFNYRSWEMICRQISQYSRAPVIIIEDLECGEIALFGFLRYLLQRLTRSPVMVCCSYQATHLDQDRQSKLHSLQKNLGRSHIRSLPLQPLNKSAVGLLVYSRFHLIRGKETLIDYVYQRSGGNPLYADVFTSALRSQGLLTFQAGVWTLESDRLNEVKFPQVLKNLHELTFVSMSPGVKHMLTAASVLGESFRQEDLSSLLSISQKDFFQSLGDALRSGWLVRSHDIDQPAVRYRFATAGLREFFYDSLSMESRQQWHQHIGLQLERHSERGRTPLASLADHFYRAGNYVKSADYCLRAAQQELSTSRIENALRLFRQALTAREKIGRTTKLPLIFEGMGDACSLMGKSTEALKMYDSALEELPRRKSRNRLQVLLKKAVVFRRQSRFKKALQILEAALDLAGTRGPRLLRARILAEMGWVQRMMAHYDAALSSLGKALKLLKWRQDRTDTAKVFNNLGVTNWTLGRYPEAQAYYERALRIYQEIGDQDRIAALLDNLGLVHLSQGYTERAVEHFQESLHLRKTTADVLGEAKACHNLAMAFGEGGQWDQANLFYSQSKVIKERIGDLDGLALTLNNLGILYLHQGLWKEAQQCQEEAFQLRERMNDQYGLAGSYDNLGDLARLKGSWKAACQYYEKARQIRIKTKDKLGLCYSLLNLGCLYVDQNHLRRAEERLVMSQRCFQEQGDLMGRMQADVAYSELLLARGHMLKSREYGERALSQAIRAGNRFTQAKAKRILGMVEVLSGSGRDSDRLLLQSAEDLKSLQARYELAKTYFYLGLVRQKSSRTREAIRFYREALLIFQKLGVKKYMSKIEKQLESLQTTIDRQESTELFTLYTMSQILNSMRDVDLLLEKVLDLAIEMLHAERGAIIFYEPEDDKFEVKIARSMEKQTISDALEISRGTIKNVAREGKPVVVDNALQDKQFSRWQSVTMYNIMSILCVPLSIKGETIGTIYLDNRTVPGIFSSRDVSFLESFANLTALAIENARMYTELHGENVYLKGELETRYQHENIIGNSKAMQNIFNIIERVSPSKANILILGESGTGKELVARLIHYSSPRKAMPFLKVNCAALTESLLESELFGIEEKIATGVKSRKGKFELADGGTIFLDEIGDMSLSTQAKVLRVLQEREFERVGGSRTIQVDVRIISATNQDLQKAIVGKAFRKDLFYRLNTVAINIPPLRDRKEDIPFLVDYFIQKYCRENQRESVVVSAETMDAFMRYQWPGNVRELENVVQRGVVMAEGRSFPKEYVPAIMEEGGEELILALPAGKTQLDDIVGYIERMIIEKALREHGYIQLKAAKTLGLSESALRYKMRKYGIKK